ncbi:hypothetical protein FO519_010906 [Halicephalobus sp. NKZ332]|nr:hypothetical protein FO519_010906 [Halicephalobus sp. NKZ332]
MAKTLQLPSEGIESSNIVFDSLKSILTGQPCGHCSHDRSDSKIQTTSQKSVPMITAYVSPSAKKQQEEERQNFYRKNPQEVRRQNSELRPENDRRQHNSNHRSNNYQEEERRQNSELRPGNL